MKLTNPESIQESEKEFIDTINAELDWDAIEQMLLDKHGFAVQEDVDYKDGNLIVHNNKIAYKFEFEIKVPLSVIFNRNGECMEISTQGDDVKPLENDMAPMEDDFDPIEDLPQISSEKNKPDKMASEIAAMVSEINQEGE
ncbi:MAG: hypothetical protein HUK40_23380 [Desulfobacter sp.]|nr:hypothetical protein [Desulfobacter sp.]WDP85970.1 MAG: hypothetical protein HUN05_13195 [Desulfobacter sp.]